MFPSCNNKSDKLFISKSASMFCSSEIPVYIVLQQFWQQNTFNSVFLLLFRGWISREEYELSRNNFGAECYQSRIYVISQNKKKSQECLYAITNVMEVTFFHLMHKHIQIMGVLGMGVHKLQAVGSKE